MLKKCNVGKWHSLDLYCMDVYLINIFMREIKSFLNVFYNSWTEALLMQHNRESSYVTDLSMLHIDFLAHTELYTFYAYSFHIKISW